MFIVSAHSRFAPIDIEKARIRIARACRMTSPVSPLIFNDRAASQSSMTRTMSVNDQNLLVAQPPSPGYPQALMDAHEVVMHKVGRNRMS